MLRRFMEVTWLVAETLGFMNPFAQEGGKLQRDPHWQLDCPVF